MGMRCATLRGRVPSSHFAVPARLDYAKPFGATNRVGEHAKFGEKDGGTKDPLERLNQAAILRSASLHAERVQHLGPAFEGDGLALLANGQSGEVKRNEAVLPPRQSVAWMAGYLQEESAVATFVQQHAGARAVHRQATEHEWP